MKRIGLIMVLIGLLAGCGDPNYQDPQQPKQVVFPVVSEVPDAGK